MLTPTLDKSQKYESMSSTKIPRLKTLGEKEKMQQENEHINLFDMLMEAKGRGGETMDLSRT